jgi:ParB family chromosome partitioning protein
MRKTGLGRGLSELISGEALARSRSVLEIALDKLEPNPYQPRQHIDDESLEELTLSIEAHGVVQPVVVRRTDDADVYQIIAGERRWRAARRAGLTTLPCIVQDADDERALEIALVENLQRSDLGPLETAQALRYLIQEFGLTQEQIAEQLGRSRSSVANTLRLLDLPEPIKQALAEGRITAGHARALLALAEEPDRMMAVFERIEAEGLNVRETEALGRAVPEEEPAAEVGESAPPRPQPTDPHVEEVKQRLRDRLGTKVTVIPRSRGGGTINITYHDAEDLDRLLALIAPVGSRGYGTIG